MRADRLLVARGLFDSRTKAQAAIEAGLVTADGVRVEKAAQAISAHAVLAAEPVHPYVSRGGLKLAAALAHFRFDPRGKVCLDLGASTGGFTDVLLRAGARCVDAVDVGRGQLHPSLRGRPDVVSLEKTDLRDLDRSQITHQAELVTVDVSFISVSKVLPHVARLAAPRAHVIVLIKPQFEAGKKLVKRGIVRNPAVHRAVCENVIALAATLSWELSDVIESPILGADGNREFLLGARLPGRQVPDRVSNSS
jgi:23S rRNA (cytidine1920-2'-O)/16S rRNA (cytidine1409-2'-O)-methyltransferase